MIDNEDGRRRDDPTPEEIEEACKRIRKGWNTGERILRRSRGTGPPWPLPEVDPDEADEATGTED
jgi:hypothetical protein